MQCEIMSGAGRERLVHKAGDREIKSVRGSVHTILEWNEAICRSLCCGPLLPVMQPCAPLRQQQDLVRACTMQVPFSPSCEDCDLQSPPPPWRWVRQLLCFIIVVQHTEHSARDLYAMGRGNM